MAPAASMATGQLLLFNSYMKFPPLNFIKPPNPSSAAFITATTTTTTKTNITLVHKHPHPLIAASSSPATTPSDSGDAEGVILGTLKLPSNIDIPRFEILLFQWGNSLCQGANLPLPSPLKVDKIPGGARLGFTTVGDETTEVLVYIDCLVFPGTDGSGPVFRAIRNGPKKDEAPQGEPRIMRSLLDALKKCVDIARL